MTKVFESAPLAGTVWERLPPRTATIDSNSKPASGQKDLGCWIMAQLSTESLSRASFLRLWEIFKSSRMRARMKNARIGTVTMTMSLFIRMALRVRDSVSVHGTIGSPGSSFVVPTAIGIGDSATATTCEGTDSGGATSPSAWLVATEFEIAETTLVLATASVFVSAVPMATVLDSTRLVAD